MKRQFLTRKGIAFIFVLALFVYGLQGISYASLEFTEGETTTREIAENTPAGANVGNPLRYSVEGAQGCRVTLSGPDASAFSVRRFYRAVQLTTRFALDYETKNIYNVTVTISGGEFSDTIDVTILVTDVGDTQPNNPPMFPSDGTTRAIVEGTLANRNIGSPVSATDSDGDTLTYSLSGNSDAALFNIDASSGQLKTKAALDHKTKPQCMVKVEVSDGNGGTDAINVTITILEAERPDPIMFVRQDGVAEPDQTVKPGTFELVMDFGQRMTGFEQTELEINDFNTGATITGWQQSTNGEDYIATVNAPEIGQMTFTVPANAAQTVDNGQGNIERLLSVFVTVSGELEEGSNGAPAIGTGTPQPNETLLLANYPNPFNPETWIPYHLAKSAHVGITIYNVHGTVVRHLALGHQSPGYYMNRSHAAYWDGRNNFGEPVGSGIYFYQLHANYVSPIRKMVILK